MDGFHQSKMQQQQQEVINHQKVKIRQMRKKLKVLMEKRKKIQMVKRKKIQRETKKKKETVKSLNLI